MSRQKWCSNERGSVTEERTRRSEMGLGRYAESYEHLVLMWSLLLRGSAMIGYILIGARWSD